ncbi:MAG TPA: hypothetical protein VGH24_06100 [Solirubrobacteraceae bacterium]
MRRWTVALVVIALGLGAAIAVANVPSNPRAGRAVAQRILAKLRLPPGAQLSPSDPSGTKLAKPGLDPLTPDLVDLHQFWRVPGDVQSVFDWIESHRPAGSAGQEGGGTGNSGGIVSEYAGYSFLTPRWGGAPAETLLYTGVPARGGGTAVRVDAQVVWLLKRAASERIPGGVRTITVTERRSTGSPSGPWTVTDRVRIRDAVAIVNRLPAAQPGPVACPNDSGPWVTLVFSTPRKRLSTAYVDGGGCLGVNLWIGGRREHALQGNANLLDQLSSALGISL